MRLPRDGENLEKNPKIIEICSFVDRKHKQKCQLIISIKRKILVNLHTLEVAEIYGKSIGLVECLPIKYYLGSKF